MRWFLSVAVMLAVAGCGQISPTSPESMAGTYDLEIVNVDAGRGSLEVLVRVASNSDPSGFLQLNPDATYALTVTYGGIAGTSWQTQGMYRVDGGSIQFTIPIGRPFFGSLGEERTQISVTENLNHATVRLVFHKQ